MPAASRLSGLSLDFKDLLGGLGRYTAKVHAAALKGVGIATMQLYNDAVMEPPTVPKLTGDLRGSGSALVEGELLASGLGGEGAENPTPVVSEPDEVVAGAITGTVAFNRPQAARLHEHPEYQFTEEGAGGKFLEAKIEAHGKEYLDVVGEAIKEAHHGRA